MLRFFLSSLYTNINLDYTKPARLTSSRSTGAQYARNFSLSFSSFTYCNPRVYKEDEFLPLLRHSRARMTDIYRWSGVDKHLMLFLIVSCLSILEFEVVMRFIVVSMFGEDHFSVRFMKAAVGKLHHKLQRMPAKWDAEIAEDFYRWLLCISKAKHQISQLLATIKWLHLVLYIQGFV